MEFISSNLRNCIENDPRLREIENQIIISKQISSGMNFLHSLNPHILVINKFFFYFFIIFYYIYQKFS